jgi:hypothetical protein
MVVQVCYPSHWEAKVGRSQSEAGRGGKETEGKREGRGGKGRERREGSERHLIFLSGVASHQFLSFFS